jgi:hypothetical protein
MKKIYTVKLLKHKAVLNGACYNSYKKLQRFFISTARGYMEGNLDCRL